MRGKERCHFQKNKNEMIENGGFSKFMKKKGG